MTIIKVLLTIVLLFAASQSVPFQDDNKAAGDEANSTEATEGPKKNPYRLSERVVPIHYDIKLIPHIVEGNFTTNGETSIDVQVRDPMNTIALHIRNITIDEPWTKLTRKHEEEDANSAQTYIPKQHHYDEITQILSIQFEELLDREIYTLHLKFAGILATNARGFYRSHYIDDDGNKVWLAMTHFQPVTARQAFPCWDEPAIKATFKFSIKHYPNYTALSNMPSTRAEVDETDAKVWTHFETTPVMSTNILAFVIADYDHISNLDGTIRIWSPKHLLQYAPSRLEFIEKATREFEEYVNSTVRVPKMDHVTAPEYTSFATENWGMIVYRDNVLLKNETESMAAVRIQNIMTITHELAHQWFGNLVSPAWWQYLWLSEGMATYLKYLITDKIIKEWRIMDYFVADILQNLFRLHYYKNMPINRIIIDYVDVYSAYNPNTYFKTCIVLHMLANTLTQDVFRNGLIKYLQAHEYSSVTSDDLWKALQDALDESDVPHDDFKVKEVMDTWVEQPGHPIVTIERDYITGNIKATQKRFQYPSARHTESDESWWIPINFATQSNLDFSSTLPTHWLKPQEESLTIEGVDVNDWIIVNKQLTGFYRVNYDITNWKRIAVFLNSDDYEKIAVANRAQIITDAFFALVSEQLDIITYMEIINYLSHEVDPVVWLLAFQVIDEIDDFPRVSAFFKRYIFGLTQKLREDIGLDDRPDDNPLIIKVRNKLFKYACTYEDPECREKSVAKLHAYLEDPVRMQFLLANKISYDSRYRDIRYIVICFGLMNETDEVWNQLRQVYDEADYVFAGCSTNLNILKKQLNSHIDSHRYYDDLFSNMRKDLANVDRVIDLVTNNSVMISKAGTDEHDMLNFIVMMSNTKDQLQKMETFAKEHRNIDLDTISREKKITTVDHILLTIRNAFKENQFSVAMYFPDNDILNTN